MHRFPAVKETMVDRAGGQAGSSTDAILVKMQHTTYMNNIETCLVPLLPQEIKVSCFCITQTCIYLCDLHLAFISAEDYPRQKLVHRC